MATRKKKPSAPACDCGAELPKMDTLRMSLAPGALGAFTVTKVEVFVLCGACHTSHSATRQIRR